MRTLLKKIFIDNWQRKLISIILACITWLVVNHSMITTKTFSDISIKIINIPPGKTLEGMQTDNVLDERIALTLTGSKHVLDELSNSDLEVIIDAANKGDEWITTITKNNLVSFNPDININKGISKVSHHDFIIKLSKLSTERIPILVTKPIGEAPKGFQFLDVWPYQLYITISGPENIVKQLKNKGLKLTFNLNDISKNELNDIYLSQSKKDSTVVSFLVPSSWKKISLPHLSPTPIIIDDPEAKKLRIDFEKNALIPFNRPIQISIFYPENTSDLINPNSFSLAINAFVYEKNGLKLIKPPLYAFGVSRLFVDIVKDMVELAIIALPSNKSSEPLWNIQFICPSELEDKYVAKIIASSNDDNQNLQPHLRDEYLRNQFRSYMNHFRLYTEDKNKLFLHIEMKNKTIYVTPSEKASVTK